MLAYAPNILFSNDISSCLHIILFEKLVLAISKRRGKTGTHEKDMQNYEVGKQSNLLKHAAFVAPSLRISLEKSSGKRE